VIQWQDFDRAFSLRKFFGNIVKLFEADPEDEWCIETLRWWDEYAFLFILSSLVDLHQTSARSPPKHRLV